MSEPRIPEAERLALEEMLKSEGWAIFMAHMDVAWGAEACEDALRGARIKVKNGELAPEEWPFEATRILDAFAGMRANVRWPKERIAALKGAERTAARTLPDPFAPLRRRRA